MADGEPKPQTTAGARAYGGKVQALFAELDSQWPTDNYHFWDSFLGHAPMSLL